MNTDELARGPKGLERDSTSHTLQHEIQLSVNAWGLQLRPAREHLAFRETDNLVLISAYISKAPHSECVPWSFSELLRKLHASLSGLYPGAWASSSHGNVPWRFVLVLLLHTRMSIKSVSVRVPNGNRWHLQMRIIPGEFAYKGTVCKAEAQSSALIWLGNCRAISIPMSRGKHGDRTEQRASEWTRCTASQKPPSRKEGRASCISISSSPPAAYCQSPYW